MLTFEVVSKIVAEERTNPKLTRLPEDFFRQAKDYLDKKGKMGEIKKDMWELDAAKRLLNDLTEIRERKLLNMCLFYVRSGMTSENMTEEEKEFFEFVVSRIKQFQAKRKESLEGKKEPMELVAVLSDLPEFVGPNLNTYGPFKEGEVVTIPQQNADLLIKKKIVKRIEMK